MNFIVQYLRQKHLNKKGVCPKVIKYQHNLERTNPVPEIIALFIVLNPCLSTTSNNPRSHSWKC